MSNGKNPKFAIIGGGLGGALMAVYLGRAGYDVDVFEMRDDVRGGQIPGGRSINLALSHRGISALQRVGLDEVVLSRAVAMPGRMMHALDGRLSFLPYGIDRTQAIHSVSRSGLNAILLDAAEACDGVRLHFHTRCTAVDLDTGSIECTNTQTGDVTRVDGAIVVGADGAFSVVRRRMQRLDRFDYSQTYLKHGYKELTIPAGAGGGFAMEQHALHIWPRRTYMMIALPNIEGSFTCTLFWPFDGPNSFDAIRTEDELRRFFHQQFPDAVPLLPTLAEDYFKNPTGSLVTVRCAPWYHGDRIVLLGDACHAIVPFYGQGMNAAFEDVIVLTECMEQHRPDWAKAFAAYHAARKPHVDVLADLAIANFVEMRDQSGSRRFRAKKKLEKTLHRLLPRWYVPLYTMATFTRIPYAQALSRAKRQDRIVRVAAVALAVALLALAVGVFW